MSGVARNSVFFLSSQQAAKKLVLLEADLCFRVHHASKHGWHLATEALSESLDSVKTRGYTCCLERATLYLPELSQRPVG